MDERLVKAARVGDVIAWQKLIEEDPEILEKESLGHSEDSALHVAARRGKAEFHKSMHVETVNKLLKANLDDDEEDDEVRHCLVKEDDGWNPLHYAVFRG
ncbi:hypothetical protein K1719_014454 [Acacia pycnantha]|nr:hypothetical protein K1719_014454 [Acacia pycnantha]